jgi:hypothetical protein
MIRVSRLDPGAHPALAVAVQRGAIDLHTGIVFAAEQQPPQVLHLAFHEQCVVQPGAEVWCWVPWGHADEIENNLLRNYCAHLAELRPRLPYGFLFVESRLNAAYELELGPGESGLTCSTFILAVLRVLGIEMLEVGTWPSRPGDDKYRKAAIAYLTDPRRPAEHHRHAERIAAEIDSPRISPEEVAAASTLPFPPAADFATVEPLSRGLRMELVKLGVVPA